MPAIIMTLLVFTVLNIVKIDDRVYSRTEEKEAVYYRQELTETSPKTYEINRFLVFYPLQKRELES